MIHTIKTGNINPLDSYGANFWDVVHKNLAVDWLNSSDTRFRCRLEHRSIPSCQKVACTWLKWSFTIYSFSPYFGSKPTRIIVAASANSSSSSLSATFIFGTRNCHSRHIWYIQSALENGVNLWDRFLACVSWVLWITDKRPRDKRPLKMPTPDIRPLRQKTTIVKILYFTLVRLCASKTVRKVPVVLASAQTDMFAAEYRSYSSSFWKSVNLKEI